MSNKNNKFKNNNERIAYLNQKHEEILENQESSLLIDFDAALKEEEAKGYKIKVLEKYFYIPAAMPFNFSTFFLRHCYKRIKGKMVVTIPEDKMMDFLKLMFGNDFLICLENSNNRNLSIDFVYKKIIPVIMKSWGYNMDNSKTQELEKKVLTQG